MVLVFLLMPRGSGPDGGDATGVTSPVRHSTFAARKRRKQGFLGAYAISKRI